MRPWNEALAAFVNGADPAWGTSGLKQMKRLRSDGKTDVWEDDRLESDLKVWDLVNGGDGHGLVGWIRSKL